MADAGEPTRLIGRDAELAAIGAALDDDRPVIVVGEAGIGKTSVVRAAVAATDRVLYEGGAFATLAWMPHLALERATGLRAAGDADWVAAEVERRVGPDVLFVDDAQWADPGTLEVLARLAGRVALVVAARRGDRGSEAVLEAAAAFGAVVVELPPLGSEDAARLAMARAPALTPERARAVAERAGGNPFMIEELAATGEPSTSLRRAIAGRLDALDPEAWAALGALALAGRPLRADRLDGIPGLVRDGLAIRTPEGGVAVRHALLADAVLARLGPDDSRLCHRRLADLVDDAGERARHLAAAGERAAAHALALRAVAASATPGERAGHLGVAAATADGSEANDLRVDAAAALRVAGDLHTAIQVLDGLEEPADETRALAEATRARIHWSAGDPEAMRAAIDRGLAIVGGHGTPAEALLRAEAVTVTALVDGRFDDGLRDAEAAVALARRAGTDPTRALLLRATILTGLGRQGWAEALEAVVASARAAGDVETEMSAANNLVSGHEMHGRPADGRAVASAMAARAAGLRLVAWQRQFLALLANLDLHAGDLRAALRRSEELMEGPLDPLAAQQVGLTAALALVDLGRHEEARSILGRLLATAAPDVGGRGDVLFVLAEAALWGGMPGEALARLHEYREYEGSEYPTSFLVDVTAAWAAMEAGRPIPRRLAVGDPSGLTVGAQLEREALEMVAGGDDLAATRAFDAAAGAYAGFHRRGEARSRWAAADARRRAGEDGTARAALEALEGGLARDGFAPLLGRTHRSLRLLGVRRSTRTAAVNSGSRLTAREREIVALVGIGLTNQEIARRMGLGRPTVTRLLSNAMLKLGVDSRAQLVARTGEPV
jgi:DNA-binding CsgD family transcriptional regulator/tetratricopeptide (TPR) repeat protein